MFDYISDFKNAKGITCIPPLEAGATHIWQVILNDHRQSVKDLQQILDNNEKNRANRFIHEKHRQNFIITRAILRKLLAAYLKCSPEQIAFHSNEYGKIFLAQPGLHFNLSHTKDIAMYAFNAHSQVGIDVEFIDRDIDAVSLVERFFAPAEKAAFEALSPSLRAQAFFNYWTRKEAFIKAIGRGLTHALDQFSVDTTIASENKKLQTIMYQHTPWSLFNLSCAPHHAAALAVEGEVELRKIVATGKQILL